MTSNSIFLFLHFEWRGCLVANSFYIFHSRLPQGIVIFCQEVITRGNTQNYIVHWDYFSKQAIGLEVASPKLLKGC